MAIFLDHEHGLRDISGAQPAKSPSKTQALGAINSAKVFRAFSSEVDAGSR
jgi:hypothetical protein